MVRDLHQFFGEVFVLKGKKHKCFVMMSSRLCAEGNIREISHHQSGYTTILNHLLKVSIVFDDTSEYN